MEKIKNSKILKMTINTLVLIIPILGSFSFLGIITIDGAILNPYNYIFLSFYATIALNLLYEKTIYRRLISILNVFFLGFFLYTSYILLGTRGILVVLVKIILPIVPERFILQALF